MNNENKNLPAVNDTNTGTAAQKIKAFFLMLCRNNVTVSRTKEFFHIPILAFIIIALVLWRISFIAILVSLFCGVEYTIGGEDMAKETKITFRPQS